MRNLLPLFILMSAGLAAPKAPVDEIAKLDARLSGMNQVQALLAA